MAKKNPITKETAYKFRSMLARSWSAVCWDANTSSNMEAIEIALDADRPLEYGGPDAPVLMKEIDELIRSHGYDVVLKGLGKHIKLI